VVKAITIPEQRLLLLGALTAFALGTIEGNAQLQAQLIENWVGEWNVLGLTFLSQLISNGLWHIAFLLVCKVRSPLVEQ
jgi:hypothetical protein